MRIVKCEKIFLSQNEFSTWENFYLILGGLERGSGNPKTKELICKIQTLLDELWEEVEGLEELWEEVEEVE